MVVQYFKQHQPRKADHHLPKIKQGSPMNGLFGWHQALTRAGSQIIPVWGMTSLKYLCRSKFIVKDRYG
jgi:hypothetical protein